MSAVMTSQCKNRLENEVITPDIKSAGIRLLKYHSFRPTQSYLFLDKATGLFEAVALLTKVEDEENKE